MTPSYALFLTVACLVIATVLIYHGVISGGGLESALYIVSGICIALGGSSIVLVIYPNRKHNVACDSDN